LVSSGNFLAALGVSLTSRSSPVRNAGAVVGLLAIIFDWQGWQSF
jgi:hypothetical protein